MNNILNTQKPSLDDLHAAAAVKRVRTVLDSSVDALPYEITERLRAARMQALNRSKVQKPAIIEEKHLSDGLLGWLQRMPSLSKALLAIPALCLAVVVAQNTINDNSIQPQTLLSTNTTMAFSSASSVDTTNALNIEAILKEQVPLQAYLNDDFNHFIDQDKQNKIKTQQEQKNHVQKNTIVQALR